MLLAVFDLRFRRLPNAAVATFAALYFVHAAVTEVAPALWGVHVAYGAASFVVGALLFRFGWVGGGDVKLAGAVFLWAGTLSWPVLVIASFAGLVISLVMLAVASLQRIPALAGAHRWFHWLALARGVPYGVALAFGGCVAVLLQPAGHARATLAVVQLLV